MTETKHSIFLNKIWLCGQFLIQLTQSGLREFTHFYRPFVHSLCFSSLMDRPSQLLSQLLMILNITVSAKVTGQIAYRLSQIGFLLNTALMLFLVYALTQTFLLTAVQSSLTVLGIYHALAVFDESKSATQKTNAKQSLSLVLTLFGITLIIGLSIIVPALTPLLFVTAFTFTAKIGLIETSRIFHQHKHLRTVGRKTRRHQNRSANTKALGKKSA